MAGAWACARTLAGRGNEGQECPDDGTCQGTLVCIDGRCVHPDGGTDGEADSGADGGQRCTSDKDCDDGDDCTFDACNQSTGRCDHIPIGHACLSSADCPWKPCIVFICTKCGECDWTPAADGAPCNDGLFCTDPDRCTNGVCKGPSRDCADSLPWTIDSCNEVTKTCDHVPMTSGCPMGDGTFAHNVDYSVGINPLSVTTGDFNADGILDLVVANWGSDTVSILIGNGTGGRGDGTFASKVDYPVGQQPMSVTAGDFNADGILDLAVANDYSNTVSILFGNGSAGNGNGTFAAKVDYPCGILPYSVTTGDFNADGILDLAVATRNSVSILIGNGSGGRGDGTFAPNVDYAVGPGSISVTAGDFNADGILDLAVGTGDDVNISILIGNGIGGRGDGTFASRVNYLVGGGSVSATTGDFNADRILDLALANGISDNRANILLGNGAGGKGDGTFAAPMYYSAGAGPASITAGDFNADGILDLAVGNYGSNSVSILLGNGIGARADGTFAPRVDYAVGGIPTSVTVADFNHDGILDLVVGKNGGSDTVGILIGNGTSGRGSGTFAPEVDYSAGFTPQSVTVGDFNSDGIMDLAVVNDVSNTVSILIGNGTGGRGDGTFATKIDYVMGDYPNSIVAGDFNADGILDLAVADSMLNTVSILQGNGTGGKGDGTFAPRVDYPAGVMPWSVTAGDFNSDGILDLAVANHSSGAVSFLIGNGASGRGDGTFTPKVDYSVGVGPYSIAAGDFNADKIPDLAVANDGSGAVSILIGNGTGGKGDGTFTPKVDYSVGDGPVSVVAGDFNGDGILDLAVANNISKTISILLGKGECLHP